MMMTKVIATTSCKAFLVKKIVFSLVVFFYKLKLKFCFLKIGFTISKKHRHRVQTKHIGRHLLKNADFCSSHIYFLNLQRNCYTKYNYPIAVINLLKFLMKWLVTKTYFPNCEFRNYSSEIIGGKISWILNNSISVR